MNPPINPGLGGPVAPNGVASNGMPIGAHPQQGTTVGLNGMTYSNDLINHAASMLQQPNAGLITPYQKQMYQGTELAAGTQEAPYLNYLRQAHMGMTSPMPSQQPERRA